MNRIEAITKLALKEGLKGQALKKTPDCPTDFELAGYISGRLSGRRKDEIISHLGGCMACLEDLVLAEKATRMEGKMDSFGKDNFKNRLKKNLWLFFAIASFVLSFIYSRYFLQFLVASLVLSAKWIFETINARILIMIYDAWRRGGEKEAGKVIERFNNRIKP